jgi:hypothetical protein
MWVPEHPAAARGGKPTGSPARAAPNKLGVFVCSAQHQHLMFDPSLKLALTAACASCAHSSQHDCLLQGAAPNPVLQWRREALCVSEGGASTHCACRPGVLGGHTLSCRTPVQPAARCPSASTIPAPPPPHPEPLILTSVSLVDSPRRGRRSPIRRSLCHTLHAQRQSYRRAHCAAFYCAGTASRRLWWGAVLALQGAIREAWPSRGAPTPARLTASMPHRAAGQRRT